MSYRTSRRQFLRTTAAFGAAFAAPALVPQARAAALPTLRLDYAYYNPVSLVLKDKGWVEEEFGKDGTKIEWVLSLGSNKALEFLNGSIVDFGSSAGSAALMAKANDIPIKAVYIYSRPEWTALVTLKDSPIRTVPDLKGKRVAVTRGTDPHIFLLRALDRFGMGTPDIKMVLLQHPDGLKAILAKAAKLTEPVAAKELERTDLSNPAIGAEHRTAITAAGDVLKKAEVVPAGTDIAAIADKLIDPQFVAKIEVHKAAAK